MRTEERMVEGPTDGGLQELAPALLSYSPSAARSRSAPRPPLHHRACPRPELTLPRILLRRRRRQRRGWAARARPGAARAPPLTPAPATAAAPAPPPPAPRGQRRRRATRSLRLGRVSRRALPPHPKKHLPFIPLSLSHPLPIPERPRG